MGRDRAAEGGRPFVLDKGGDGQGVRGVDKFGVRRRFDEEVTWIHRNGIQRDGTGLRRVAGHFEDQIGFADVDGEEVLHLLGGDERRGVGGVVGLLGDGVVGGCGASVDTGRGRLRRSEWSQNGGENDRCDVTKIKYTIEHVSALFLPGYLRIRPF